MPLFIAFCANFPCKVLLGFEFSFWSLVWKYRLLSVLLLFKTFFSLKQFINIKLERFRMDGSQAPHTLSYLKQSKIIQTFYATLEIGDLLLIRRKLYTNTLKLNKKTLFYVCRK